MRKGLHPLPVHMGLIVSEMARVNDNSGIEAMLNGVQKYQLYSEILTRPVLEEVWRAGEVSLSCLAEQSDGGRAIPVLLVPSMINRSYIFNLLEDRSMMQYFAQQGLRPFVLDWGESARDLGQATIDELLQDRLLPAARFISDNYGGRVHGLGYCMGGTLLALAAEHYNFVSCSFLASPWDFHAGDGGMRDRIAFWSPSAFAGMESQSFLSKDWVQTVFATMDPLQTRDKFARFASLEEGTLEEQVFVAVEDWLNDGVDLPSGVAEVCIRDWFGSNALMALCGKAMASPSLIVASKRDRLVPYDSSVALAARFDVAEFISPDCGHIGMIAGKNAVADVWQPMAAFISSWHS